MGCLVSKPNTDDKKLQIPRKVEAKHRNGSIRSKHDFGVQIGTPFSKKRTHKLTTDNVNDNINITENGIVVDGIMQTEPADITAISADVINKTERSILSNGTVVTENGVPASERIETSEVETAEDIITAEIIEATEESITLDEQETPPESPITLQQKWLLQDSWVYIENDLLEFGMVFFSRLLDQNPGIKHLWSFGKMNYATEAELRADASFQDHSRRVMEMIGSAIEGLDDLEMLVPILSDLGQRHRMYGAKPEHFKAVHEALIYSYQKGLEERIWTPDVKDAWDKVIEIVASVMSAELIDDETE